jgi:hypothetical protein
MHALPGTKKPPVHFAASKLLKKTSCYSKTGTKDAGGRRLALRRGKLS